MRLPARAKMATPSSSSSSMMALEMPGCDVCSTRAAAVMLNFWRTASRRKRNCWRFIAKVEVGPSASTRMPSVDPVYRRAQLGPTPRSRSRRTGWRQTQTLALAARSTKDDTTSCAICQFATQHVGPAAKRVGFPNRLQKQPPRRLPSTPGRPRDALPSPHRTESDHETRSSPGAARRAADFHRCPDREVREGRRKDRR